MKKIILLLLCLSFVFSFAVLAVSDNGVILDVNVLDGSCKFGTYYYFLSMVEKDTKEEAVSFNHLTTETETDKEYTPHISVDFTLEKEESIYVWVKARISTGKIENRNAADSIYVSFDSTLGQDYTLGKMSNISQDYLWIRVKTGKLGEGTHTLNILARENYTKIKDIKIVNSSKIPVWDGSLYSTPEISLDNKPHPRVLVNSEILQKVKTVMADPESYPDNNNFITLHNYYLEKENGINTESTSYLNDDYKIIKSLAFDYLVNGNEEKGEKAVNYIKNRLEKVKFNSTDDYTKAGNLIYTSALVYDWCYDLIKEDNETKDYIIERALEICSLYTEMGWPPVNQNAYGGHGSENSLLRDLLAFGIAVYDEYPEVYNITAGRIEDEYIGVRKIYFNAHKSLFGTHYGIYRGNHDISCALLYKALGVDNIWENPEYQYMPYWYIYAKRGDGYFLEDGDGKENQSDGSFKKYNPSYMAFGVGSLFKDGYLKAFSDDILTDYVDKYLGKDIYDYYVESIIANDVTVEKEDISTLSYSHYFPYPGGAYIARTGWDDNSMVVSMKINPLNISDHNHLDAGGFQIYYKGNLATDSGYYQALTEENAQTLSNETGNTYYENYFGGTYHQAYYRQTIAHNCMLIENPNTPDTEFVNDWDTGKNGFSLNKGGQKSNSKAGIYPDNPEKLVTDEVLNTSKVLAYGQEEGVKDPDYTYLKGDLSGAYPDGTVSEYERSFMFLNFKNKDIPGALIVFDHVVSKDASFKKTYLLHGVNAPEIEGNRVTLIRSENTYNGKLVNDTLLPENAQITQVGETKDDYIIDNNAKTKINLKTNSANDSAINEGGGIRTEISPVTSNEEDYFLNVMQVSDANAENEPLTATLIESDTHHGVEIYDRVVMFGKTKEKLSSDISFDISGIGSYNISVTDLKDGIWYIYKDDIYKGKMTVSENDGIAYFTGTKGEYKLTRTVPEISVVPGRTTKFFFELGNYEEKNAFITFGKILGLENNEAVIDYGMVFINGIKEPTLEDKDCHKISVKDKNFTFDSLGNLYFGTVIYGNAILNYKPYSIRTYAIIKENGKETVKYGDVTYDYVRNFSKCNSYPLTVYEVNE